MASLLPSIGALEGKVKISSSIPMVVSSLKRGALIAYPTESVYGIGCDAWCQGAVERLQRIKKRQGKKGFILLISEYAQLDRLIDINNPSIVWDAIRSSWPGPVTWVFPCHPDLPKWLVGVDSSIAIRMTAHPIAREICQVLASPLISTSANLAGMPPCINEKMVTDQLSSVLDICVHATVCCNQSPTSIIDAITLIKYR